MLLLALFEVLLLLLAIIETPTLASPSIEDCPHDSVVAEDACKCDRSKCLQPPCPFRLEMASNGTDVPGRCCPTYRCVGCKETEQLEGGQCPCAEGAVIKGYDCQCVDNIQRLVNGVCQCDPSLCPLPELCDKKSVPVFYTRQCCKLSECKQCPADSESTMVDGEEIEDHCVCLPCKTHCGYNTIPVVIQPGKGIPGKCCDLYECKKMEKNDGCVHMDVMYENGQQWVVPPFQTCKCENGLALCSTQKEKDSTSCFVDNRFYDNLETWTKDEGCTFCTCKNGLESCISHYCDQNVNLVHRNNTCTTADNQSRVHLETWIEKDNCTKCSCYNGAVKCNGDGCEPTTTPSTAPTVVECQPLANCNKTCLNGYRINRKGCEICKCNPVKLPLDILTRYNISMNDLIQILDDYNKTAKRTAQEKVPAVVVAKDRNVETTVPTVTVTDKDNDSTIYIVIIVLCSMLFVAVLVILSVFLYKNRRKNSLDISNCHYKSVNNNTIKKTDQLL